MVNWLFSHHCSKHLIRSNLKVSFGSWFEEIVRHGEKSIVAGEAFSCGSRSLRLLAHICVYQEAGVGRKEGWAIGLIPQLPTCFIYGPSPSVSRNSRNSVTSWGPSVKIHEGNILHLKHNR